MTAATKFGRSIGLRDDGNFIALIEAGYTPGGKYVNPRTRRLQYFLSPEDISAFHRCFVTLPTLSREYGVHRNTIKSLFASSRISRFSPGGQDFGPVYLRSEAGRALV